MDRLGPPLRARRDRSILDALVRYRVLVATCDGLREEARQLRHP